MNIFGKYIDDNQQVLKSLTKIYGIGRPTAKELCMSFGIGLDKKVKELSKDTWSILIKAAEIGPYKYKDLVKELQNSGLDEVEATEQNKIGTSSVSSSNKVDPLIEAIESFVSLKEKRIESIQRINGKLRSQKVEVRALTDLRERIEAEKKMKSYKGLRHLEGLPVRGQRTSTNALTARKRRK